MSLSKVRGRTISRQNASVSIVIPAHNEGTTIADVISGAHSSLDHLAVPGEVIVSASDCVDDTAAIAQHAGATVVESPNGKGAAIAVGVGNARGDIVCLVDGDLSYYGDTPLAALLIDPILHGIADATIANLYWRPIYPDQWLNGFFVPLAGHLFPELLPKAGSTPWSGQRAAVRNLWPSNLPTNFTVDLALTLHWNEHALQMRPVLTDDWFNPIRPKPEILGQDFDLLIQHAISQGRLDPDLKPSINVWFQNARKRIDSYDESHPDPIGYERNLLETSLRDLHNQLRT